MIPFARHLLSKMLEAGTAVVLGSAGLFVLHAGLSVLFPAEAYGHFSYALAIASILGLIAPLGSQLTLLRLLPDFAECGDWARYRGAIQWAVQRAVLVGGLLASVCLFGAVALPLPAAYASALTSAALIIPALAIFRVIERGFQAIKMPFASILGEQILLSGGTLGLSFVVPFRSGVALSLIYGVAGLVIAAGSLYWFHRELPRSARVSVTIIEGRTWARMSLPLMFGTVNRRLLDRADVLLLGVFASMATVGAYSLALRLVQLILIVNRATMQFVPAFVAEAFYNRRGRDARAFLILSIIVSVAGGAIFLTAFLFFSEDILMMFGASYAEAADALIILSIGYFALAVAGVSNLVLVATGRGDMYSKISAWVLGLNVVLLLSLVPAFSMIGAATAVTVSLTTMSAWQLVVAYRQLQKDHAA